MVKVPELLAPAGTQEQLEAALLYGADAVYLGGGELSLRAGRPFTGDALTRAVGMCHARGVKVYYCINAFPRQQQWRQVEAALEILGAVKPDALIIADAGVLRTARTLCPHVPVHLSTQANTGNAASAAFWADMGVTRVNLARELPLGQIRAIRQTLRRSHPDLEVECFVHGALCLALSGQCLLSAWLQDRPANEGRCTQPCRYKYTAMGDVPSLRTEAAPPSSVIVEEGLRPSVPLWEVTQQWGGSDAQPAAGTQGDASGLAELTGEGEQGDYAAIWSPEDICLLRFLPWFARVGVDSLKIEGRMRTGGYVAHAVDAYRTALDSVRALATKERRSRYDCALYETELRNTATRTLSTGFFIPRRQCCPSAGATARQQADLPAASVAHALPLLARVEEALSPHSWRLSVRGRWNTAQAVSLVLPHMQRPVLQPQDYRLENAKGEQVSLLHSGTSGVLHCDTVGEAALQGMYVRACAH